MLWYEVQYAYMVSLVSLDLIKSELIILHRFSQEFFHIVPKSTTKRRPVFLTKNAAENLSALTTTFSETNNVYSSERLANYPDLYIIENVWGQLVRPVYAIGPRYNNFFSLQGMILNVQGAIDF